MNLVVSNQPCACGSGASYGDCCEPLHRGAAAQTPEALMRSRFCAYRLQRADYVLHTWHPSTRPGQLDMHAAPEWIALQMLSHGGSATRGQVHFRAVYRTAQQWGYLEELSAFVREDQRWYYLDGQVHEGVLKPGRNDPCPCGSGRKFKTCCHLS